MVLAHAYENLVSEISAGWWDVADRPKEGPESQKELSPKEQDWEASGVTHTCPPNPLPPLSPSRFSEGLLAGAKHTAPALSQLPVWKVREWMNTTQFHRLCGRGEFGAPICVCGGQGQGQMGKTV